MSADGTVDAELDQLREAMVALDLALTPGTITALEDNELLAVAGWVTSFPEGNQFRTRVTAECQRRARQAVRFAPWLD